MLKLSIIIVNYNTTNFLRQSLDSLYSCEHLFGFETIVVDNNSHDGSVEMVRENFPRVHLLLNNDNTGFAKANNTGFTVAKGRYILLLNSDTKVLEDALETLILFLDAHPDFAVVAPRLLYPDLTDQGVARSFPTPMNALFGRKTLLTRLFPNNRYARKYMVSREHSSEEPFEVDWVSGACLMVRKELFDTTDPLDDNFFMYWEDLDLCYRIKKSGWKIACIPKAKVIHYEGKSMAKKVSNRCIIAFHRGAYRYYRKHHIRSSFELMNVVAIAGLTIRTLLLLATNLFKTYTFLQEKKDIPQARVNPKQEAGAAMKKNKFMVWLVLLMIVVFYFGFPGFAQTTNQNTLLDDKKVPVIGQNLLMNSGFEEKGKNGLPKGWQLMPDHRERGKAEMDDRIVQSGKFSLKLSPGRRNKAEGFGVFMKLNHDVLKGREVTISGYARLAGMNRNPAAILFKADRDNWLVIPQSVQNEFFSFSKTCTISDSASQAMLFFITGGTQGSAWLDDLSLTVNRSSSLESSKIREPLKPSSDVYFNRINTPGWQDSPFISPDGQDLYFAYMPYTQKDHIDILFGRVPEKDVRIKGPVRPGSYSTLDFETYKAKKNKDGSWGAPFYVKVEGAYSVYAAKVSFEGSELYYVIRDHPGGYGSGDIFVSEKLVDGTWGPPENLGTNINTDMNEETPCISADGTTLYFARNRGDALGFEIMVSRRIKNKWTKAEKMPNPINEPRPGKTANHQPFITADGKELYFTRIQQLYKSTKQADNTWGKPVQVFPNMPVSGHASVTADGKYLYFLTAKDREALQRENWSIWYSQRKNDESWDKPRPVD